MGARGGEFARQQRRPGPAASLCWPGLRILAATRADIYELGLHSRSSTSPLRRRETELWRAWQRRARPQR